jgi:pimeloyl-ACP methyl ester carboxylesterase
VDGSVPPVLPERRAQVGDVELCYEVIGAADAPAMLLVMGLGFQLIHWPDEFCRRLADAGYRVVRFDNRDAGRSTHLSERRYGLDDLADDVVGLMDALAVDSAHLVGASMGGMIVQTAAIRHPGRVRSLASLMSTTGRRGVGRVSLRVLRHLFSGRPRTEDDAIERRVRVFAEVGSTGFDQDFDELRRVTRLAIRRDPDARQGRRRPPRALRAAADRTAALERLTVPTVVVHGTVDRMCHPSGGRATATAIPGARLELIDGMGHDLPPGAWPRIIQAITDNANRGR